MRSKQAAGRFARTILWTALVGAGLSSAAMAATKTGTTTIAVRVERHVGIVLPTSASGLTNASFGGENAISNAAAFGNGSAQMRFSRPAGAGMTRSATRNAPERVEVTVFEP